MAELGNVLEPESEGPRGPDLLVEVRVPRAALGEKDGYRVEIPRKIAAEGGYVERVSSPHDEDDTVLLHLPEGFPSGGTLKLRGQGGACEDGDGPPGDLLVEVELTGGPLARADPTALAGRQVPVWMSVAGFIALVAAIIAWALT